MPSKNLGRVSIVTKGTWNKNTVYNRLDAVVHDGSSWLAKKQNIGQQPMETSDAWQLLAAKGAEGKKGDTGPQGPPGDNTAALEAAKVAMDAAAKANALVPDVEQLKDDLSDNAKSDAVTKRSLDALWRLNQGISYQFETDDSDAYNKTVPSGAELASVGSIGGKTIAWNQLVNPTLKTSTKNGVTATRNDDGSFTINGTAEKDTLFTVMKNIQLFAGHKYLLLGCPEEGGDPYQLLFSDTSNETSWKTLAKDTGSGAIYNCTSDLSMNVIRIAVFQNSTAENLVFKPMLFDITNILSVWDEQISVYDTRIAWIRQYAQENPGYSEGDLLSAAVSCVITKDSSGAVTGEIAIPEEVRNLPGYGWSAGDVRNAIQRTENGWQYVQRVGSVDLGDLSYGYSDSNKWFHCPASSIPNCRIISSVTDLPNILAASYQTIRRIDITAESNMIVSMNVTPNIVFRDSRYTNAEDFKAAMPGVMLYYELDTPVITDITNLMAYFQEPFQVEVGGTITFENAAKLTVPNSVEYVVSLAEVGSV